MLQLVLQKMMTSTMMMIKMLNLQMTKTIRKKSENSSNRPLSAIMIKKKKD
jgi:hypothetical protein